MTEPDEAVDARRRAVTLRGEFVRAFTEHASPRPASELMTVRLPAVLTLAALAAVVAIVVGVFWQLLRHGDRASAKAPDASYSAVAGWDCQAAADHGFVAQGRTADWRTIPSGGWGGDGCHGTYEAIPMSGKADRDDAGQSAVFWFAATGSKCEVNVYVPSGDDAFAAASAAQYAVLDARDGKPYAHFAIEQSTHRGQWVTAGAFPIQGKEFVLRLTNRGVPAHPEDRLAVAQVRLDCAA